MHIKRNANANSNINKAFKNRTIHAILTRIIKHINLDPRLLKSTGRYVVVGNKNEFLGIAQVHNTNNGRELNLIGAKKGYGDALMRRIINNAVRNKKKAVYLQALNPKLVAWYKRYNFVPNKSVNGYTPMMLNLTGRVSR